MTKSGQHGLDVTLNVEVFLASQLRYFTGGHGGSGLSLITRDFNGLSFTFRADGWFNMTKVAKHFGKSLDDFWRNQEVTDYLLALHALRYPNPADSRGLPPFTKEFVETKRGNGGGTWAHPKLAVFFARWLDVRFAVWCDAAPSALTRGAGRCP